MRLWRPRRNQSPEVPTISRRELIRAGSIGAATVAAGGLLGRMTSAGGATHLHPQARRPEHLLHETGTVGEVDHERNGFDPTQILDDWDFGTVSRDRSGRTVREYTITAIDKEIEIAPGLFFPAWTYNGRVPGPTIRCGEGDRLRIEFVNGGTHPHTIHFHGIHSARMDGIPGVGAGSIEPGGRTVYEFDAVPFGCHHYHCHSVPLKRHIHKGLYGAFIVDPDPGRGEAAVRRTFQGSKDGGVREMMMMMNAFDTTFDGENEVYAVNTVAFHYQNHPIRIGTEDTVRVYLINITEFDPINSFHLHANFFDYYDHGTTLEPTLRTVDTIMQCQAQRGILEFNFNGFEPGPYMFHAHQSEFVELGWMGLFDVVEGRTA